MKVAIFTCNTGGGHNAAAEAIADAFEKYGIECKIKNALSFVPRAKKEVVENGHSLLYKYAPKLYSTAYLYAENQDRHYLMYLDYARYSINISKYLKINKFDAAVCVHEFPAFMLTNARKMFKLDVPQFFVATDYAFTPGVEETVMDMYFVPKGLKENFIRHGIDNEKITESGIPVDSFFYEDHSKIVARKKLGLRDDVPLILLSAGSIGCGPIKELALKAHEAFCENCIIVVLCGNNRVLLNELSAEADDAYLLPVGFTNKAKLYMSAADLMISKPGGLTSTESATCGLPVIFLDAVPGLETHNMDYFVANGCAIASEGTENLEQIICEIKENPKLLENISIKQRELFHDNSSKIIADSVIEFTGKNRWRYEK